MGNWKVKGTGLQTTYTTTKVDGSFLLPSNGDSVVVTTLPPNNCWTTCPDSLLVIFPGIIDTISISPLYAQSVKDCPLLEVDVVTSFLRRCFLSTYHLQCKNTGTVAAENKLAVIRCSLPSGYIFKLDIIFIPVNIFTFLIEINFNAMLFCQIHQPAIKFAS